MPPCLRRAENYVACYVSEKAAAYEVQALRWDTKTACKLRCRQSSQFVVRKAYKSTVANVQRKAIPNDGSSFYKTRRIETCRHEGQTAN